MENNITKFDPFLYRSYEYDNLKNLKNKFNKNNEPNKIDSKFKTLLREKMDISSDKFSVRSQKKDILNEIKQNPEKRELYSAAEQFESYFIEKVFREMKKNVPKNSLINGGYAEEIFDEMLLTERIREMAHAQEFGLAEMIYDQMNNFSNSTKG
ncbi:MAG: rod-binding protein [Spirochaetia bacterium]|nr:rod-binding protein [Spirochaetia bacterium]